MRRLLPLSLLCLSACGLVGGSTSFYLDELRGGMTERETLSRHSGVPFKCGGTSEALRDNGQEVCQSEQVAIGDTTAANIAYFFRDGKLTAAMSKALTSVKLPLGLRSPPARGGRGTGGPRRGRWFR